MMERTVNFAGSSVTIRSRSAESSRVVADLFGEVPAVEETKPHVTFTVDIDGDSGPHCLLKDGKTIYKGRSIGTLARLLMDAAMFHIADKSGGGLLFHAAALSFNNRCIILPGATGSGKSTLAAWLAHKGFTYLTDELVYAGEGSNEIQAFTRPLDIKLPALPVLEKFTVIDSLKENVYRNNFSVLLPPRLFNKDPDRKAVELGLIVFPQYRPEAEFDLKELTKARTGMLLMGLLVNARNLPGHGFQEICRLSKMVPGFRLRYSHFEQISGSLKALLA